MYPNDVSVTSTSICAVKPAKFSRNARLPSFVRTADAFWPTIASSVTLKWLELWSRAGRALASRACATCSRPDTPARQRERVLCRLLGRFDCSIAQRGSGPCRRCVNRQTQPRDETKATAGQLRRCCARQFQPNRREHRAEAWSVCARSSASTRCPLFSRQFVVP